MGLYSDSRMLQIQKRIKELMPGKNLDDVVDRYELFYEEWKGVSNRGAEGLDDMMNCLDKYADVLEISDMFQGEDDIHTWASYRENLELVSQLD
jgi:hypothetical protein